jgi:GNAT superfamily N-acetyltransferase
MIETRVAADDELDAYVAVWNAVTPDEPADVLQQRERRERDGRRLNLLATHDGRVAGCGFAGPSQSEGRGFLAPRVLPAFRHRGVGSALLDELRRHLVAWRFETASAHVDGTDEGSLAFAERHGFEEVDRQVEQVWTHHGGMKAPVVPDGLVFASLAQQPGLLRASYDLALEGYADMATFAPVSIPLDDWLRGDDANVPEGSLVALAGDEIVGFSGLCRSPAGVFEDGLTVVRRAWRRRGVAEALKHAKLAWAAANGVTEIVTWTQTGNDGMRAVNERLGYAYRAVSINVRAALGAPAA